MSIFNIDGKFYGAMLKISDIIILNCLFILMSIPLVTIGANLTALNYVGFKIARDEEYHVFKSYLKSFKENFKQATIIWSIMLVIGFSLVFYVKYFDLLNSSSFFMRAILFVGSAFYVIYLIYIFPLLSRFEFSLKGLFSSLPLIAIRYIFCTLFVMTISLLPLVIFTFWIPEHFSVYLTILAVGGIAGTVTLNDSFFSKAFDHLAAMKD